MIRQKRPQNKIVIDITGPQGNTFFLIGTAIKLAKQIGMDDEPIVEEMMSGDYENLIDTFDRFFGNVVILER